MLEYRLPAEPGVKPGVNPGVSADAVVETVEALVRDGEGKC